MDYGYRGGLDNDQNSFPMNKNIINRFLIFFSLIVCCAIESFGQEVDLVRLGYTKSEIAAEQIGMAASPDGKIMAFVYSDKTIKIFDVGVGKFIKRFKGPYSGLFDVYVTANGKIALINEKEVQLWDWKKEQLLTKFSLSQEATKAAFTGVTNYLAVGQKDGVTAIFDLNNQKFIREITLNKHHVGALAFHPNGKSIVIGVITALSFSPQPLTLFDVSTGEQKSKSSETGYFTMVAFNEKGDELMAAGLNGSALKTLLITFDGSTLRLKRKLDSEINLTNSRIPYGALFAHGKLFALTVAQSFNVSDAQTGTVTFTTKSDRMKTPPFMKLGSGSYNVFLLGNEKILLNASKNNINQLFDSKSNTIVGYFFSDSNDDFAIVSRDGRIDGTPEALNKLYWTSRNSLVRTSLESTFDKGFSPRLLSQILESNSSQVAFDVDDVVGKVPVLNLKSVNGSLPAGLVFTSTQKNSKIEIEVKQNLAEVNEVRLYQNSKLVKALPNQGNSKFLFDAVLSTSFGEENFFYATATSHSGIEAEKVKFTISYKGATSEKPNLYLITIGINQYKNSKYNLNYAQADADAVEKSIKGSSSSLFKEVISFPIRNDKAIKTNILKAFDEIKRRSLEQDVLFVYYAGHGVMSEGGQKAREFFIIPYDITQLYGRDELLFEKAISAEEMKGYAQSINAQKQVFILDACQSAGALESVAARGAMEEKAIAQMARSTGTFWITASGSNQFATEFEKLGHGVFTYALLEGVKGKADANGDQKLTIRELSTYIENKVPELSEQFKGLSQFPSAYSFGNDFPIVIYK